MSEMEEKLTGGVQSNTGNQESNPIPKAKSLTQYLKLRVQPNMGNQELQGQSHDSTSAYSTGHCRHRFICQSDFIL